MELQRMLQFSYHLQYFMQPNIFSKIPDGCEWGLS